MPSTAWNLDGRPVILLGDSTAAGTRPSLPVSQRRVELNVDASNLVTWGKGR